MPANVIAAVFALAIAILPQTSGTVTTSSGDGPGCSGSQTGAQLSGLDSLDCGGQFGVDVGPVGQAIDSVTGAVIQYVPYDHLTTGTDGRPCITTSYRPAGSEQVAGEIPFDTDDVPVYTQGGIYSIYPPCPLPEGAAPAETPESIALRYWERIPLPRPAPEIDPGWAITGKLAYLETKGEVRHAYDNSTALGPLQIVATGTYRVDWGDGETSGPFSVEGRPWPDGEITHEYQWARQYDVVVTEHWTATWSLAGRSGTLRELQTTGRIDDFPARQVQAVIR